MPGVINDAEFESKIIMLKNDDTLVLYTDGVAEALNKKGKEYDDKRLVGSLQNTDGLSTNKLIERIISDVRIFTDRVEQSDDIGMLLRYFK